MPQICDYEGSKYRTDFWEGQNRQYEDRVERIAMQKLLPSQGERLIEVGAGFGRLADLYDGYKQIVLTDYARTQLEEAQNYLGDTDRYIYVVADVYRMPFVNNLFDTLTMVRVMHHLADVPTALNELQRIVRPEGTAIIEHASKFHLKSLLRWASRRQDWNPFDHDPVEFVDLNFDFHPAWMREQFQNAGFEIKNTRTVSHYRLNLLKRTIPTDWLVTLDGFAQSTGNWWQLTPSIFLQAQTQKVSGNPVTRFFRCPECYCADLEYQISPPEFREGDLLFCENCKRRWTVKDRIYDFKTPLT